MVRDYVHAPGGVAAVANECHVQDDGDARIPVWGVAPRIFTHTSDAHAFKPSWTIDQQAHPFGEDNGVVSISEHA